MDVQIERVYARWCARSVLHLWDAPEVVRRWVDTGEDGLREEAWVPAASVVGDAALAAAWALGGVVGRTARSAVTAAAKSAARSIKWASPPSSPAEAWDVEEVAAKAKQQHTLDLLDVLPDLLRAHGLAARLLDDVRADPWLTREVVRALALPDLGVWCDWYKQMEDGR